MMGEREQRQLLAMRLASGKATEEERDQALAEILLSLWSEKELVELIDKRIEESRDKRSWFRSLFSFSVK